MTEAFRPPAVETNEALRTAEEWRMLEQEAPAEAARLLEDRGLLKDIETLNTNELKNLYDDVGALIDEFSFDAYKKLKNENRYIVREIAVYLNKIEKRMAYSSAPTPTFLH